MTLIALVGGMVPVLIVFVAALATDFGRDVKPEFAQVAAQFAPVLFLAAVVESRAAR